MLNILNGTSSPRTPALVASSFEHGVALPPGPGDRYAGYVVLDVRFRSGHVLALRRFPVTSLGTGYTSVWHKNPSGKWTVYSDVPDTLGCGRYFRAVISESVVGPIRIDWADTSSLVVEVDGGQVLRWSLDLAVSSATYAFNALAGSVPLQPLIDLALRAGGFRLVEGLADGFKFRVLPQSLWVVASSRAVLGGRDLGVMAPSGIFAAGAFVVQPLAAP